MSVGVNARTPQACGTVAGAGGIVVGAVALLGVLQPSG